MHRNSFNQWASTALFLFLVAGNAWSDDPTPPRRLFPRIGCGTLFVFGAGVVVGAIGRHLTSGRGSTEASLHGRPLEARARDANRTLFGEADPVATFRFSREGELSQPLPFFYGDNQRWIARRYNDNLYGEEKNPEYLRRLDRLYDMEFEIDGRRVRFGRDAFYAEFDGIIFERVGEGRAKVFLSGSTREFPFSFGTLDELKPLLRVRPPAAGASREWVSRQTIDIRALENGEEMTLSWFPAAQEVFGVSGQLEAAARIRYDRTSGKIQVPEGMVRLVVTGFVIRGGRQEGTARFERIEGVRSTLSRKPLYRD